MADFQIQSFGLKHPVKETSSEVLGGKGAGLVWMDSQGFKVPPGFILPTSLWSDFTTKPKTTLKVIDKEMSEYLDSLKVYFGYMPLLSVRSGARVSCPGMMDTILNVGLDSTNEAFWRKKLGDDCYYNSLHRLVVMYGSVVKGLERKDLEAGDANEALVVYAHKAQEPFPMFKAQLLGSIGAVFESWNNERAVFYRKVNNIPAEWGTACVVQAMVMGNLNQQSGSGVFFSRDTDTGLAKVNGEFLQGGQGEDVVAGIIAAPKMEEINSWNPDLHQQLVAGVLKLEELKRDVVDVEATVQDGDLYFLQVRTAKRSAQAAIKIALDMVEEKLITPAEALYRVSAKEVDLAQRPVIDPFWKKEPFATGIPACSGVVSAKMVFTSKDAINCKGACILVTNETNPDDIEGMYAALGVLTMQGGATSHAAVVARSMNKPCVVGLQQNMTYLQTVYEEITIDGSTGKCYFGVAPVTTCDPALVQGYLSLLSTEKKFMPVIMDVPKTKLSGAWLVLGDAVLNPKEARRLVVDTAKKVDLLYVDFSNRSPSQDTFLTQMGGETAQDVLALLEEMTFLHDKVVVLGIKSDKFKTVSSTNDLESLILATDSAIVGGVQTEATKKVLAWKLKDGLKLVSVGDHVEGATNFLSYEQAM